MTAAPDAGAAATDRGAAATEMVLVMPVLILFLFLVVASGRLTDARSDVVSAAGDAARAASLERTAGAAEAAAQRIATATLAGEGIECDGGARTRITHEGAFGPDTVVHAHVECDVPTGDLALLALPGTIVVEADAWERVDPYRSR